MIKCKRLCILLSLFGALVLFFAAAMLSVGAQTGDGELIVDGSFDRGDLSGWPNGWANGNINGVDAETDHTETEGSASLKLENATRSNQHAAQQVTLVKGQSYLLKAAIKIENVISSGGGTGAFISLGLTDSNSIARIGYYGNGEEYGTNDWFEFSSSFTALEDGVYTLRIRLWGSSGTMWTDDVSLKPIDNPEIGLDDGKFSSDKTFSIFWNAGWKNQGAVHEWSDISHTDDGTGSLKIEHAVVDGTPLCTSSYAAEDVFLIENAKYKVSGWIKTENIDITSANNNTGAYFAFDEKYNFYFGLVAKNGSSDWTYCEDYFTAAETGVHKMECKIWGASGTAYFDDIQIEMVAEVDPDILKHWTEDVVFPADDGGFTLVGVGDTQGIADAGYAQRFLDCFEWLAGKKEEYNIQYVAHLGDIVDNYKESSQWQTAVNAHQKLQDADLKYSLSVGNHDYDGLVSLPAGTYVERDTSTFNSYFKKSVYDEWLGDVNFGAYNDTMDNTWHKFEADGYKYMIIALEYGPNDDVLSWAKNLADTNPDYNVIVTTHAYMNGDAVLHGDATAHLRDANGGNGIWTKFVKKCPNIFMVLCGHYVSYGVSTSVVYGDAGNSIVQIKIDPQNILGGGEPMLALMRITNGTDLSVYYYSTYQNKYYAGSNFSIKIAKGEESGYVERLEKSSGKIFEYEELDNVPYKITYSSSDTSVATVDEDGIVTCLKPGTATITCDIDSKQSPYATSGVITKYSAPLKVNGLEITELYAEFDAGGEEIFTSNTLASLKSFVTVTGKFNDGNVYTVDNFTINFADGETSLKEGLNTLTVTSGNCSAFITVEAISVSQAGIEATYANDEEIYASASLSDIKEFISVKAIYNDGSETEVTEFTLSFKSGEQFVAGNNLILVSVDSFSCEISVEATAVVVVSVYAEFNQGDAEIYTDSDLSSIKNMLTVKAKYNDGSEKIITDYTLNYPSGKEGFEKGENIVTVSYGSMTANFTLQASKKINTGLIVGITVGAVALVGAVSAVIVIKKKRSKKSGI